jgi:iron(III) transport system permease protein
MTVMSAAGIRRTDPDLIVSQPGPKRRWRLGTSTELLVVLSLIVLALVVLPVLILIATALRDRPLYESGGQWSTEWWSVLSQPGSMHLILNSLAFTGIALFTASVLTLPAAWLIERTHLRARRIWRALIISSMALSPGVVAFAWVLMAQQPGGALLALLDRVPVVSALATTNIQSIPGMGFVGGVAMTPTAFTILAPSVRSIGGDLEEASHVSGAGILRTLLHIDLPLLRPAATAALLIMAITMLGTLEIPIIVGSAPGLGVFASRIYRELYQAQGLPNANVAAVFGVVLMLISLLLLAWYYRANRLSTRFATVTGRSYHPTRVRLRGWQALAQTYCALVIAVILLLPLVTLLYASALPFFQAPTAPRVLEQLNLSIYTELPSVPGVREMVTNTMIVAVAAATVVTLLGLAVAWATTRFPGRLSYLLGGLTFVTIGIPTILIATGLFLASLYLPFGLSRTKTLLVIAFTIHFLAFTFLFMRAAVGQVHTELEEAARVAGSRLSGTVARVTMPLVAPAFAASWLWVLARVIRDMTIAPVLSGPDSTVIGSYLWQALQNGAVQVFSAISVLMAVFLFGVTLSWEHIGGRRTEIQ